MSQLSESLHDSSSPMTYNTIAVSHISRSFLEYINPPPHEVQGICQICYESRLLKEIGNCGHLFCAFCIRSYLETKISESEVFKISCPECLFELSENVIRENVSEDNYKKYLRFLEIRRLERDVMVKWCPMPNCEGYDHANALNYNLTCNKCKCRYCYICSKPWHRGRCKIKKDLGFEIWTMTNNVKICPQCKNYVQKNGGCPHMYCPRCLHRWCWICGEDYSQPSHTSFTCLFGKNPLDLYWGIILLMLVFPMTVPFFIFLMVVYFYETESIEKERLTGIFICFRSRLVAYSLSFVFSPIILILSAVLGYFAVIVMIATRECYNSGTIELLFRFILASMISNLLFASALVLLALLVIILPVLGALCIVSKVFYSIRRCFRPRPVLEYPRLFG